VGSLRLRFVLLAVVFAVASGLIQYVVLDALNKQNYVTVDGVQTGSNNYALISAVSSFSSLCLVASGAFVVGVVALSVVDYAVDRRAGGGAGDSRADGSVDVSGELTAYGSDPELL
jgi:hypothetical protein